jgi:hypothetical protein
MFEIASAKTFYQSQEDSWGQSIVQEFYECGGFDCRECLENAHTEFSDLIPLGCTFDGYWGGRSRSLALWAYICIELDLGKSEIELPIIAITAAQESLPRGEHPDWRIQLAFDILSYKFAGESNDTNLRWIEHALRDTSQLAWPTFDRCKFDGDPMAKGLKQTVILLKRLAVRHEIAAANLILFSLVGKSDHQSDIDFWLEKARRGESPVKQLATFYMGCWQKNCEKGPWVKTLQSLDLPPEDDPDYPLLASIASNAVAILHSKGGFISSENVNDFQEGNRRFERNVPIDPEVLSQFETVDRLRVRLSEKGSSREISERVRNLSVETGRLIEATLKQGLISWFSDIDDICIKHVKPIKDWEYQDYRDVIGELFGNDEKPLNIGELLVEAGLKFPTNGVFKIRPVKDRVGKKFVWGIKTNLISLVIANLFAAKCNPRHPFRHFSSADLIHFLKYFNVAYGNRNLHAHFSIAAATEYDQALETVEAAEEVEKLAARFLRFVE